MKAADKLRADWSKRENDIILHWPLGSQTKCDASWLSDLFNKEVTAELEKRGYDVKTLKFSIEPQKGNDKFASQREEEDD